MKLLVLVKQVPDTWGDRSLDLVSGRVQRTPADAVIDEISERAIEVALRVKDADKVTEVVLLTMGPVSAKDALIKGLAMGADSAVHVVDDALAGSDLGRTAEVLAAVARSQGFDLVIAGNESTDGRGGVVPAMIAEHLGWPHISNLDVVDIGATVAGTRSTGEGTMEVHAGLPAVISVSERVAEPRFSNFKGIMTAKKKPMLVTSVRDLGIDVTEGPWSLVTTVQERPARSSGTKIIDDGTAGTQLAEFLTNARII